MRLVRRAPWDQVSRTMTSTCASRRPSPHGVANVLHTSGNGATRCSAKAHVLHRLPFTNHAVPSWTRLRSTSKLLPSIPGPPGTTLGLINRRTDMKALAPDTNFWLHANLPVDFAAVAGTTDVVIVVPQTVLRELDRHQHEGRRTLKNRARDRVMTFRRLLTGATERSFGLEAIDQDGFTYWLMREPSSATGSADDRIVATAAQLTGDADDAAAHN